MKNWQLYLIMLSLASLCFAGFALDAVYAFFVHDQLYYWLANASFGLMLVLFFAGLLSSSVNRHPEAKG